MKILVDLFRELDQTNSTNEKIAALVKCFERASNEELAWVLFLLSGRRPARRLPSRILREAACQSAGISDWLFEECYISAGDLAETIALIHPLNRGAHTETLHYYLEAIVALKAKSDSEQIAILRKIWTQLDREGIFLFNKLVTGGFRVGVSEQLVLRALSQWSKLDMTVLAGRFFGDWQADLEFVKKLLDPKIDTQKTTQPYPFFLASPLVTEEKLESISDYQVEWKWDGIRAQVVFRDGKCDIWSRGEERVTPSFPELHQAALELGTDCVLDGEILGWEEGSDKPAPFSNLQRRLGRKNPSRKILSSHPTQFLAYDLLEESGQDLRTKALFERRKKLEDLLQNKALKGIGISPLVFASDWQELRLIRATARERRTEGLMIKKKDSPYLIGRKRGHWWKWKIEPLSIDAVLLYAQAGHGRRSNLFTDYTFAVRKGSDLVPVAKAYSGLTDEEILEVDDWIRKNTLERFGPVRSVTPELVFEIAFEGIQLSTRHKSGIALRFPRISRRRTDKKADEIDTIEKLQELLQVAG